MVLLVGVGDVTEEDGTDNASSAPHESDTGVVEGPLVLLGGFTHEHESLSVGDTTEKRERESARSKDREATESETHILEA